LPKKRSIHSHPQLEDGTNRRVDYPYDASGNLTQGENQGRGPRLSIHVAFGDNAGNGNPEVPSRTRNFALLNTDHYYPLRPTEHLDVGSQDERRRLAGRRQQCTFVQSKIRLWRTARSCKSKIPRIGNELGLGWYDYGARMYDPVLGRFTGVDPIADQFPHVTTFNYAENEPVAHIDLWGLQKADPPSFAERAQQAVTKVTKPFTDAVSDGIDWIGENYHAFKVEGEITLGAQVGGEVNDVRVEINLGSVSV